MNANNWIILDMDLRQLIATAQDVRPNSNVLKATNYREAGQHNAELMGGG